MRGRSGQKCSHHFDRACHIAAHGPHHGGLAWQAACPQPVPVAPWLRGPTAVFAMRMGAVTVRGRLLMAIVLSRPTVAAAAAAVLQVFEADLVRAVTPPPQAALDIRRVSVQQHGAHSHRPGQFVRQGALAVGLACKQVIWLFAHHCSCRSRSPDIHRLCRQFCCCERLLLYQCVSEGNDLVTIYMLQERGIRAADRVPVASQRTSRRAPPGRLQSRRFRSNQHGLSAQDCPLENIVHSSRCVVSKVIEI